MDDITYMILDADNVAVSFGTVVADPLPDGLTAVALTAPQAALVAQGARWTGTTFEVATGPVELEPVAKLAALLAVSPSPTVDELAAVVGVTPDALAAEVESWAAAGGQVG